MTRLLPDLRIAPIVKRATKAPVKQFDELISQKIIDYDTSAAKDDLLASQLSEIENNTTGFIQDIEVARAIANKHRERLNNRAEQADYENMTRETTRDVLEFTNSLKPLQERKAQYFQYIQNIQDNDKLLERQKQAALKKVQEENNIPYNSLTGLQPLKLVNPANPVDIVEFLDSRLKGIKGNKTARIITDDKGNEIMLDTTQIKPSDIQTIAKQILQGSTEVRNFQDSENALGNTKIFNSEVSNALAAMINKYANYEEDKQIINSNNNNNNSLTDFYTSAQIGSLFPSNLSFDGSGRENGYSLRTLKIDDEGNLIKDSKKIGLLETIYEGGLHGALLPRLKQYFSETNETFSPEIQKEVEAFYSAYKYTNDKYKELTGSTEDLDIKKYAKDYNSDEFVSYQGLSKKEADTISQLFYNPKTGGGFALSSTVIPAKNAKNVIPGVPLQFSEFLEQEHNITINDLDDLIDSNKSGINEFNIYGKTGALNSVAAAGLLGSFRGSDFIIQQQATPEAQQLHKLYTIAKTQNGATTEIQTPVYNANGKQIGTENKTVQVIYNPYSSTKFDLVEIN